jgi:hypothetical protein
VRELDSDTARVIERECGQILNPRLRGQQVDSLLPLRALHEAKTIAVNEMLARGWDGDEAWHRVSKWRVEVVDPEYFSPGDPRNHDAIINVTDEWTDADAS